MYSELYFKKRTDLSIVMIVTACVAFLLFLVFFIGKNPNLSKAAKQPLLQNNVVNVSVNQIGIFWHSQSKESGWVVYGKQENQLDRVIGDDRDLENNEKGKYYYHFVLLKDLDEEKTYYYKIVSENGVYDSNGQAFKASTVKSVQISGSLKPAYGKVIRANETPADNVYVIFYVENRYPVFTISKLNGEILLPINYLVDRSISKMVSPSVTDKVRVEIFDENGVFSTIETVLGKTNPLPQTIILGNNYRFVDDNVLGVTTENTLTNTNSQFTILFPKENAVIPATKPLIKGTAPIGQEIAITVSGQKEYVYKTKSDSTGIWKIEMESSLAPGNYTLTVSMKNQVSKTETLKRIFMIAKSGEQVLGVATAEPTIATSYPTTAPTVQPTTTMTYVTQAVATTSATISPPRTGQSVTSLVLMSAALIIVGFGLILVF